MGIQSGRDGRPAIETAGEIRYEEMTDGKVEICRELCNALMAHQADQGVMHPEVLRAMNFDNRLRPSFETAEEKQLIVAFDGEKPVGYAFASAATETEASRAARPAWAASLPGVRETGLYPEWLPLPAKIGCLNNLYVLPPYRGRGIASALCERSMCWLRGIEDIRRLYVYVSNGNENVVGFYGKFGFTYSHEVFGGFITAYDQKA